MLGRARGEVCDKIIIHLRAVGVLNMATTSDELPEALWYH